MIYKRKVLNL